MGCQGAGLIAQRSRYPEVADLAVAMLRNGYLNSQVVSVDGGMYPR